MKKHAAIVLSQRDDDAQVGEAMAMANALNQMTLLGMPGSARITGARQSAGSDLFNNASLPMSRRAETRRAISTLSLHDLVPCPLTTRLQRQ